MYLKASSVVSAAFLDMNPLTVHATICTIILLLWCLYINKSRFLNAYQEVVPSLAVFVLLSVG